MHHASLTSDRLRNTLAALADGAEHSTLDLMRQAGICAVSAVVSELRANGCRIDCRREGRIYYYRLRAQKDGAACGR